MRKIVLLLCMVLVSCMPSTPEEIVSRVSGSSESASGYNPFPANRLEPKQFSNADLKRDFLDLSFSLESGTALPRFTRFEGPSSVRVMGMASPYFAADLNRLLARLKSEAGIDIHKTNAANANITIQLVSQTEIQRLLPTAACFVAPNVTSLDEFQIKRKTEETSWSRQTLRRQVGVFLPNDVAPQETRDCLHEEFAQALGPLNDLYRLPQSVFNDDNVHTVLTPFDMMILRITYAPELRSGMSKHKVTENLDAVLNRLNPAGDAIAPRYFKNTSQLWKTEILKVSSPATSRAEKKRSAAAALKLAQEAGWNDHRLGISLNNFARALQVQSPYEAQNIFEQARDVFKTMPEAELHNSFVALQLAHHYVSLGQGEEALEVLGPAIRVAGAYENAALVSVLMFLKAEALELMGKWNEASKVRLDTFEYARYGFGSSAEIRRYMRQISRLNPIK